MKLLALTALVASASASKFPSFDMFHAKCELKSATCDMSCDDFIKGVQDFVANNKDPASPPGTYTLKEQGSGYLWSQRKTANGKYIDDVMWTVISGDANSCKINAKSRSETPSYLDNSVNYCNSYNALRTVCKTVSDIQVGTCSSPDKSQCNRY